MVLKITYCIVVMQVVLQSGSYPYMNKLWYLLPNPRWYWCVCRSGILSWDAGTPAYTCNAVGTGVLCSCAGGITNCTAVLRVGKADSAVRLAVHVATYI